MSADAWGPLPLTNAGSVTSSVIGLVTVERLVAQEAVDLTAAVIVVTTEEAIREVGLHPDVTETAQTLQGVDPTWMMDAAKNYGRVSASFARSVAT